MKMMFRFLVVATVIAVGFTSCSKDEFIPEEVTTERASLTVTIAGSQATRAIGDQNANTEELKATRATIFVFNAQNAFQVDTTVMLGGSNDTGTNAYKVKFNVPTGNGKKIYVGLNFTNAMIDSIKQKGLTAMTYGLDEQEGLFYKSSLKNPGSATFGGNPMFNTVPFTMDINQGSNVAVVNVERLTSKITVVKEGDLASSSDVKASNATFNMASLEFAIGNKNTKILPMKEQLHWIDPNWDGALKSYLSDFKDEFSVKGINDYTKWDLSKYVKVDDNAQVAISSRNTKYAFENTHKQPRKGEITYVSVKVKFEPDAIAKSFDELTKKPIITTTKPNMDTLHVVVDNNTFYYYTSRDEATKHVKYLDSVTPGHPNQFITYRGQLCFYNIGLNSEPSSKEFQTKRNEFYSVGLAKINKLGNSYPEIEEGSEEDIEGETSSITVNINVNPWTLIDMGGTILE